MRLLTSRSGVRASLGAINEERPKICLLMENCHPQFGIGGLLAEHGDTNIAAFLFLIRGWVLQPLKETCHPKLSLGLCFWSTARPTLLHFCFDQKVGAPTAEKDMSSRILIAAMLLEHCDTNIAALCS